jgi:hypothetical protein
MTVRRAICVSHDDVRPVVATALAAAGLTVEHLTAIPDDTAGLALVVVDRMARQAAGDRLRDVGCHVVVIGDDLDDDGLITLRHEAPVSHHVGDPEDRDLRITSVKLVSGDLFGLEKYLAPSTIVGERIVRCGVTKRRAIDQVCAWAEASGARRPTVHRITSVTDELLMNALREGGAGSTACLRWGADDAGLAISVGDGCGSLRQRDVIEHVRRARRERGRPEPATDDGGGAGLGLYLVLANVAGLVVNVAPGNRTEVVCLFDRARGTHPSGQRVRSLHVFGTT